MVCCLSEEGLSPSPPIPLLTRTGWYLWKAIHFYKYLFARSKAEGHRASVEVS